VAVLRKTTLQKIGSIVICSIGLYLSFTGWEYGLFGIFYLAIGIWCIFTYFGKRDEWFNI